MLAEAVVIVGAGPSGVAASIQLKREGLDPLLFEGDTVGGLVRNANLVENLPGFPGGIRGFELAEQLRRQLEKAGVRLVHETVRLVEYKDNGFLLFTDNGKLKAERLVIATGTRPRPLGIDLPPGEPGKRVLYEVHPIRKVSGSTIAIIGSGDAALDYALNLARGNHVEINLRGLRSHGLPFLRERVDKSANIHVQRESVLARIEAGKETLRLYWKRESGTVRDDRDLLLVAVGRVPNDALIGDSLRDRGEELEAEGKLFLIGDVRNGRYRQTAIAAGDGIRAAMKIAGKTPGWKR